MDWKKDYLKDTGKFRDGLVKSQPIVSSVNKRANETQFVGKRCKTKVIFKKGPDGEGFLKVNTSDIFDAHC